METPQFIIVKPGLQRKNFWTEFKREFVGGGYASAGISGIAPPVQTGEYIQNEMVTEGYKAGVLGLISPRIKDFYKEHGFNYNIRERDFNKTGISYPRPRVRNDSAERSFSCLGEYTPDERDILVLTYDPRQEIEFEEQERYSLLPLFKEEILQIGTPGNLDELVDKYKQNGWENIDTRELHKSYKRFLIFDQLVNASLVDIGEIPIRISTRVN